MEYFQEDEAGIRYDKFRPKVHHLIIEKLKPFLEENTKLTNAIDIACGTGDSTLPLLDIADTVIGVDMSKAMLARASTKGLNVQQLSLEELEGDRSRANSYNLITTCMAFHWFDREQAIQIYKNLSANNALWLIYNFQFYGHSSSSEFNTWLVEDYLKNYPTPPRNKIHGVIGQQDGLTILDEGEGILPINFDLEGLIGYLSTQSNIEAAVKQGRSYQAIEEELRGQLKGIGLVGSFNYRYSYEICQFQG